MGQLTFRKRNRRDAAACCLNKLRERGSHPRQRKPRDQRPRTRQVPGRMATRPLVTRGGRPNPGHCTRDSHCGPDIGTQASPLANKPLAICIRTTTHSRLGLGRQVLSMAVLASVRTENALWPRYLANISGPRRGGRVVEGTPLLRVQRGNPLEGSNPFLSAIFPRESVLPIRLRPDFLVVFEGYAGGAVIRPCCQEAPKWSLRADILRTC